MKILYQSPNYSPNIITNRYLSIDLRSEKAIVDETVKTERTNYTFRKYELPDCEYALYAEAIESARKRMHLYPNAVELKGGR